MGAAADNSQTVANKGDGLLVSGRSQDTQVGGVIPLGNVISGNNHNGIEVSDAVSGFTSFNTFAGTYAFGGAAPNKGDGILVTSDGGNNLIRTCIVSGNLRNGIELGGGATGVQVTETSVGTNSDIQTGIPNGGDGILVTGHAHDNAIGGFQPSIEPQVTISANRGYAIDFSGSAHDNVVFHTTMGANASGQNPLGNRKGGIYMGQKTSSNTIGGAASAFQNIIRYNGGSGITIKSSPKDVFIGNSIQFNAKDGINLSAARSNTIGTGTTANTITSNARKRHLRHGQRRRHDGSGKPAYEQRQERREALECSQGHDRRQQYAALGRRDDPRQWHREQPGIWAVRGRNVYRNAGATKYHRA